MKINGTVYSGTIDNSHTDLRLDLYLDDASGLTVGMPVEVFDENEEGRVTYFGREIVAIEGNHITCDGPATTARLLEILNERQ